MKIKLMTIIAVLSSLLGLSLANANEVSKGMLQKRAAFALGVEDRTVKIENIEYDGMRVDFIANVNNKKIRCYVVAGPGVVSDAICSGHSNALLDAANSRK